MTDGDPRGDLLRAVRRFAEAVREERDAGVRWHLVEGSPAADPVPAPVPTAAPSTRVDAPGPRRPADAAATLAAIAEEVSRCTACRLASGRTRTVPGEGDPRARVFFVGEGPGEQEDLTGRPFVGRAGKLLRTLITEELGRDPSEVFIANVVKCRPPENRAPLPDEAAACLPFLRRQVAAVRPEILVPLGNPATQALLQTKEGISRLRGRPVRKGPFRFLPTYHPSYLLRNQAALPEGREDFRTVRAMLEGGEVPTAEGSA